MTSFLKVADVDADDIATSTDAMVRLRANDLGAVIVRGVYPKEALAKLPPVLAKNAPDFVKTTFPPAFCAYFYGINLNLADSDLAPYFAAEPDFRAKLAALDFGGAPLERRITGLLSQLDEGRAYGAAPGPDGARHFFTTLRAHLTGGYIPAHFDNEAAIRPTYQHVAALCEPEIYSFVLCIDQAEAGGALDVYNLSSATDAQGFRNRDTGQPKRDLSDIEKTSIRLEPGEMVILHSSRYLHGVSKVQGDRTRWTVCSFMALAKDGSQVYCWG
ncbi:2OG-Fe(II) oxygenase [Yoonia sp. GPGPB17]|uniref:2OG-Fe(II) oxygenase n=1 Tax=Yoonia sp. GPGPB17 TaxID=3026147 RepID=UPI0030C013C4